MCDLATEMQESLPSLMKSAVTPITLHFQNRFSFKHPFLILSLPPTITYILYHMASYKLLTPPQSRTNHSAESFSGPNRYRPYPQRCPRNHKPQDRVLVITSVKGLEPTYLTTKSGKWLVILKKYKKTKQDRR